MSLPTDYLERVYAGVLGKLVGVYLGRPFEGWTHQRIMAELGHIRYYVHERMNMPCVVTDDDVSGTFAFVRAFEEHGGHISAANVGKTWLNNVVEKKSVFWWGGRGISTEHTAYLNLKHGIPGPDSGSIETNGKTVAEQIGAQIFIDGWAMIAPCRPELASQMAREAGRVSHDGESVYAAMLWAAMESEAFQSDDAQYLLDVGLGFIPSDSLIARGISDVRSWVKADGDWLKTRQRIEDKYGYDKFCGWCHVVPNHLIMIMTLLYARDFDEAMEIVMTSGWDTDCNGGNVGCLFALMYGMKSFDKTDWRGPIADRALISTADNGYSLNNAARITFDLVNMGRHLGGKAPLSQPKSSQFHFSLPGSVQGFMSSGTVRQTTEEHGPALQIALSSEASEVMTQTAAPKDILNMGSTYPLSSSPLVYSGQRVTAALYASSPVEARLRLKYMDNDADLITIDSEPINLRSKTQEISWILPRVPESYPIAELGVVVGPGQGHVYLDRLNWSGSPDLTLQRPSIRPHPFWDLQWVRDVTDWRDFGGTVVIANDVGEGVVSYGTRDWTDYQVTVNDFTIKLGSPAGVLIRNQGLRRWYGVVFTRGEVSLVKALDDERTVMAKEKFDWVVDQKLTVHVEAVGSRIAAQVASVRIEAKDDQYKGGGVGFVVTDGALSTGAMRIQPAV